MSEEQAKYQSGVPSIVVSEPQRALAELSAHYAQIPEDLLASGNPSAVVVYGILDRIAKEGKGWTSIAIIAERSHLGTATVQRARAWLIQEGWVIVIHQGRSGRATDYLLPWRSTRQHIKPISLTNQTGMLENIKVIHHPEPSPEPKIPKPSSTTTEAPNVFPEWFKTLSQDPRWHGKDPERYIQAIEKEYHSVNLDLEAHSAYEWLQSPKGQKKKVLRGFWRNWLKNGQTRPDINGAQPAPLEDPQVALLLQEAKEWKERIERAKARQQPVQEGHTDQISQELA